jgi:hypothetical protein
MIHEGRNRKRAGGTEFAGRQKQQKGRKVRRGRRTGGQKGQEAQNPQEGGSTRGQDL